MKIEDKIDQNRGDRMVSYAVRRGKKLIDFSSILCCEYHLYSSEGQWLIYIYMYSRERIYKELTQEIQ
jgi:hypothetical protein